MKLKKILVPLVFIISVLWLFYFVIYPVIRDEKTIMVPNIIGLTEDEGIKIFKEKNIKYEIIYEESNVDDIVLRTNPSYNTLIKESFVVEIYVAQVKSEKILNMVGMAYEDALSYINYYQERFGIRINIKYEKNNLYDDNIVLYQSAKDDALDTIDEVTILISYSELWFKMPNFVGQTIDRLLIFQSEYGVFVKTIFVNSIFERNMIIYQDVLSGTKVYVDSNDEMTFYVAK